MLNSDTAVVPASVVEMVTDRKLGRPKSTGEPSVEAALAAG